MAEGVTRDDLRAAVASGVIDEAQAVSLQTLSDQRMGYRANMVGDDEPFELFKGFAEIFVTVGLVLLMAGFVGLTALFGDVALLPVVMMALAVGLALYFTKQRRMTLPSIALCIAFGLGLMILVGVVIPEGDNGALYMGVAGMFAIAFYYRAFRLPFAMFVFGVFGLMAITGVVNIFEPPQPVTYRSTNTLLDWLGITRYFDLQNSPFMAVGTLIFGTLAFIAALHFDTKDPHRVSRYASTAFWLHILAAPALVNTLVMSNYTMGGIGTVIAIVVLTLFTLLAVIIDRRSFLTAGLIYMGLLIAQAIGDTGTDWAPVITTLVLGVFVTALGAFWTQARAAIMGALPDFPGKDRLPPYAAGLAVSE
ncbi:hypothetical protein [uncultured Litoreibacter sp.]|uniref:hypothetical protein n=1 Tax=uncultured Litoreibacter sp. TaxID=1392394 RepID=UPI00262D6BBC|nr:hypothetical protein [uncultured Litoreibacter sp.]